MKKMISALFAALFALSVCFAPTGQARMEEPGEGAYLGTWRLEQVEIHGRRYSLADLQGSYRLELALAPYGQGLLKENDDPAVTLPWTLMENGEAAAGGLNLRLNEKGLLEAADGESGVTLVLVRTGDAPELATPAPVVKTPSPIVVKTAEPTVQATRAPIVIQTVAPVVVTTTAPVVVKTQTPLVRTATPVAVKTPEPVVVRTPEPIVVRTPEPVVVRTPEPVVVRTPEPIVVQTMEPIARTPLPVQRPTAAPAAAPTAAPTARPTAAPTAAPTATPAPAKYVDVRFVCTAVTVSGFAMDPKDLGGEYAVLLRSNGTAEWVMAGYTMRDLKWKMDGKDYLLDYYTQQLRFEPENGKLLLKKYQGTMDLTFSPEGK